MVDCSLGRKVVILLTFIGLPTCCLSLGLWGIYRSGSENGTASQPSITLFRNRDHKLGCLGLVDGVALEVSTQTTHDIRK